MIRITIELPNGPNTLNELGNITTAALTANATIHIKNESFIPTPMSGEVPVVPAIPADSTQRAQIEDFAHEVQGGNGRGKALK